MRKLLVTTILVTSFCVAFAAKNCKCNFSDGKVKYHVNNCGPGHEPTHQLQKLPNYPWDPPTVIRIVCDCQCKMTHWHKMNLVGLGKYPDIFITRVRVYPGISEKIPGYNRVSKIHYIRNTNRYFWVGKCIDLTFFDHILYYSGHIYKNKTENAFQILDRDLYCFTKLFGFNTIQSSQMSRLKLEICIRNEVACL